MSSKFEEFKDFKIPEQVWLSKAAKLISDANSLAAKVESLQNLDVAKPGWLGDAEQLIVQANAL